MGKGGQKIRNIQYPSTAMYTAVSSWAHKFTEMQPPLQCLLCVSLQLLASDS